MSAIISSLVPGRSTWDKKEVQLIEEELARVGAVTIIEAEGGQRILIDECIDYLVINKQIRYDAESNQFLVKLLNIQATEDEEEQMRWSSLAAWIFETLTQREVSRRHVIRFVDGDPTNCRITNMRRVLKYPKPKAVKAVKAA